MWWSPDSRKLAFYRFDESRVRGLLRDARPDARCRPPSTWKRFRPPGAPNPVVDLYIYDVVSDQTVARRRAERQALRQQRRRPLRVSRGLVARWPRIALLPDESASERVRAGRRGPGDRRRPGRFFAKSGRPAGSTKIRGSSFSTMDAGSSGNRSATAGTTSTSTISAAS